MQRRGRNRGTSQRTEKTLKPQVTPKNRASNQEESRKRATGSPFGDKIRSMVAASMQSLSSGELTAKRHMTTDSMQVEHKTARLPPGSRDKSQMTCQRSAAARWGPTRPNKSRARVSMDSKGPANPDRSLQRIPPHGSCQQQQEKGAGANRRYPEQQRASGEVLGQRTGRQRQPGGQALQAKLPHTQRTSLSCSKWVRRRSCNKMAQGMAVRNRIAKAFKDVGQRRHKDNRADPK